MISILEEISSALQKGKAKDVSLLVKKAVDEGIAAQTILNEALIAGMAIIGAKFRNNEVFVPEVLVAARAMNHGLEVLKPELVKSGVKPVGKAVIATVKGDLHDIGKNLVKMMLEGQGFEVLDLGVDIDSDTVIDAVINHHPEIVCLSALLSTTMTYQKEIIEAITQKGLRDQVKILVGGAPVTENYAREIHADGYAPDAASAAELALRLVRSEL